MIQSSHPEGPAYRLIYKLARRVAQGDTAAYHRILFADLTRGGYAVPTWLAAKFTAPPAAVATAAVVGLAGSVAPVVAIGTGVIALICAWRRFGSWGVKPEAAQ